MFFKIPIAKESFKVYNTTIKYRRKMMKKQISNKGIFVYCLGDFSRGIIYGLITSFLLPFFIPTDAGTSLIIFIPSAALAMAIIRGVGVVWDAVTDPLIASLSDKSKNKNGRRIPFMKFACIPLAIFCVLIFFPPINGTSVINAIWVGVMLFLYYTFSTIYNVPYSALQAELVSDTKRRVFMYTINSLMFVIASAIVFSTFAIKGMLMANGIEEVWAFRIPFLVFGFIGLIAGAVPAFCIHETDYVEPTDCYMPILKSLKATFKYKNFTILTLGFLIMWVAFTFFNAAQAYYIKNLLGQSDFFVTLVLGISIIFGVASYPLLNKLVSKIGKKPLLIFACIVYTILYFCIYMYKPILNVIPGEVFAIGLGLFIAFPIAITNIIPAAAFADLAQYDAIKTGEARTGMFVAAKNFVYKLSNAIVISIVAPVLLLGSTDGIATEFGIRLTALIACVFVAFSIIFYFFYNDKEIVETIDNWNEEQKANLTSN